VSEDLITALRSGSLYRFGDWPNPEECHTLRMAATRRVVRAATSPGRSGWAKRLLVTSVLAGLLAGCSTGNSAPTTTRPPSLAQDQTAVNHWTAQVAVDEQAISSGSQEAEAAYHELPPCAQIPAVGGPCTGPNLQNADELSAEIKADAQSEENAQVRLPKDQFQLQVAQDQLTKDEG
jgi:hypothetical protein